MPVNYVLLEKIVVGAAGAASVTFNSIPQTGYTDLVIKGSVRTNRSGIFDYITAAFNGSSANFTCRALEGDGAGGGAGSSTQATFGVNLIARAVGATATANTFSSFDMYIPNYAGSSFKSFTVDGVTEQNASTTYATMIAGLWSQTAAITSLTIGNGTGNLFAQYSTFYLYGVAKLDTTPAIVPYATGGDTIMTDGTYWYHAFLSSGTFTPQKGISCDVLVVAGGGGGGGTASAASPGGGGGAGGIFYATTQSLSSAQTVTIGAGGAKTTAGSTVDGNPGTNTTFGSLTAAVGGGFGSGYVNGGSGGSGGGARNGGAVGATTQTGTGGTGYGSAGGAGFQFAGGGGGGSGAAGSAAQNVGTGSNGGAGGAGLNTWSTWLSTTGLGVSGYIAGGGGGGAYSATGGTGGSGGGGAGNNASGTDGTANTGGGGGGSGSNGSSNQGGAGGSGIVIVRYTV